jgi:hypothetical protein
MRDEYNRHRSITSRGPGNLIYGVKNIVLRVGI